ncbi:hypothetical protein [Bradyrhizobium sp. CCGE-LA001]|uniref:hypothetical protein n=1 Tax=Bradyrhizobium sp. CCGE-LA001 TaxID=1223566 RepID=UPI000745ED87|nr:hypothetical protein [Bradyrhizobium sp. CCGE-LA001]AMA58886.1 hypothetical protein BCCGELA001_23170 [Bradyrhizobium sp. CCGE-LA001]
MLSLKVHGGKPTPLPMRHEASPVMKLGKKHDGKRGEPHKGRPMKKLILLAVLLLSGCQLKEERLAAENAADDQKCLSYGAKAGTDAYVVCRTQLATSRDQTRAARRSITCSKGGAGQVICD